MDYQREVESVVKTLSRPKAAALAVVCAMMWLRRCHSPVWEIAELVNVTGFSADAIGDAKPILLHCGLVRGAGAAGRYGLVLVDRAVQQLGLWDLAPVGEVLDQAADGLRMVGGRELSTRVDKELTIDTAFCLSDTGKSGVTAHVVSCCCGSSSSAFEPETTTTTDATPEKAVSLELPARYVQAWGVLCDELGMPAQLADLVTRTAFDEDWGGAWLEFQALRWLVYCCSERGASIRNVPYFVAARLQKGEVAPGFVKGDSGDMRWRIDRLWREVQQEEAEHETRGAA
jgi:hypothetical protein